MDRDTSRDPTVHRPTASREQRAVAAPAGVALLVLATVALSATVGAATLSATGVTHSESEAQGSVATGPHSGPTAAVVGLAVTDGTLVLTHRGGDTLDVRRLRVVIRVDGSRLRHQPSVPFFAARGFKSGPTGPFNRGYDGAWTAGETASVALASTNHPTIAPGDRVAVALYANDALVARASTVARNASETRRREHDRP